MQQLHLNEFTPDTGHKINNLRLHQVEMVCLEDLVPLNHRYRFFKEVVDLSSIKEILSTMSG